MKSLVISCLPSIISDYIVLFFCTVLHLLCSPELTAIVQQEKRKVDNGYTPLLSFRYANLSFGICHPLLPSTVTSKNYFFKLKFFLKLFLHFRVLSPQTMNYLCPSEVQKRASETLEQGVQMVVNCHLGTRNEIQFWKNTLVLLTTESFPQAPVFPNLAIILS